MLLQRLEADTVVAVAVVVLNADVAITTVVEPTIAGTVTFVVIINDAIANVVETTVAGTVADVFDDDVAVIIIVIFSVAIDNIAVAAVFRLNLTMDIIQAQKSIM